MDALARNVLCLGCMEPSHLISVGFEGCDCTRMAQTGTVLAVLGCLLMQACGNGGDSASAMDEPAGTGGTPSVQACVELSGRSFWANAVPILEDADFSRPTKRQGALTGVVEEIRRPTWSGDDIGLGSDPSSATYALRVATAAESLELSLSLPGQPRIAEVGATLRVRYAIDAFASNPNAWELGWIEVRDEEGELLAWIFEGGPDELYPPAELEIEEIEGCTFYRSGPIVRRGLRVTTSTTSVDVSFGDAADVGDFVVLHGDNTDDTAVSPDNCYDCVTRHRIAIAVVRRGDGAESGDQDAGH